MSHRVCRKFTSSTFKVEGQLCKIFLEPLVEYQPGYYIWNVGFAIGKSSRQLNDWYKKRKNKRARSLTNRLVGRSGLKAIRRGFEEVLRLRWRIEPGDGIVLDCTSADPVRQFHAWSRWHKHHPEWVIDYEKMEFLWYRPPYADDPIRNLFNISAVDPEDPLANTTGENYFAVFRVQPKSRYSDLSSDQIIGLLSQVLATG
jgi:hypothetical protein